MNKKLLLILSILMSLSLFTMSCANSVLVPDIPITEQSITQDDIVTELRKIGIIYADSQASTSNPLHYIDINRLQIVYDHGTYSVTVDIYPFSGVDGWWGYTCDPNYVLSELRQRISALSSAKLELVPNTDWDNGTIPNGKANILFTVNISSKFLTIPEHLKSVKISLVAFWSTAQP
ncbi:hypothetical protein [Brachyspira intermedia]|uniref:hypothetical protein n=1 Tax=Brachyspira intermedia TaxID=84377 RepID=UPI0030052C41